ncbi:YncE family protein [Trinickia sp. YCB016]
MNWLTGLVLALGAAHGANAAGLVYVPNLNSNTVQVISQANNAAGPTINVGSGPLRLAASSNGQYVYVANASDNTVSVINTATQTVAKVISVPGGANDITVTSDGKLVYVGGTTLTTSGDVTTVNYTISVINASTYALTSYSTNNDVSKGLVITPDGKTLYGGGGFVVSVVDTATFTSQFQIFSTGEPVQDIRISPDGTKVYVSTAQNLVTIGTATNEVTSNVSIGQSVYGLAVSSDGSKVYIAQGNGAVSVFDTTSNTVTATINTGSDSLLGIDLSPDGTVGYVGDVTKNQVYVFSTSTNAVTATVAVGQYPGFLRTVNVQGTPHTLQFYLHGNDVAQIDGSYAATQTAPATSSTLFLGVLSSLSWLTDPVMTGSSQTGAAFTLTIPCTVGIGVGLSYTLQETDSSGGSATTLATVSEPLAVCVGGTHTVTFPVSTLPAFSSQRLKLTISNLLALGFNLQTGASTYLKTTQFSGTP